jgi:hypothetical protein
MSKLWRTVYHLRRYSRAPFGKRARGHRAGVRPCGVSGPRPSRDTPIHGGGLARSARLRRIAALVEYFEEYAEYLVVALLPEDAAALDEAYQRVTDI